LEVGVLEVGSLEVGSLEVGSLEVGNWFATLESSYQTATVAQG
jgi:hypothetical protein